MILVFLRCLWCILLACYDSNNEEFQSICKVGTGLTEAMLEERSASLLTKVIPKPKSYYRYSDSLNPDVWFDPSEGISLRFPCLIRVRGDKPPEQARSSEQVAELYNAQAINHSNNQIDNGADVF
ncbi:DNA ligase 1-like [Pyrus x bretschneideri]|uniref:DNA ligase 1-like n=1 Tax=Pyrus x bretschneideri TaxID=225117 RepID=UPI00202EF612|nr:DNA ligase 1-like [Pyrus x bretschneideri]XP_048444707.1 DNA ligase 1-like [Pyrus x bretschneideri]